MYIFLRKQGMNVHFKHPVKVQKEALLFLCDTTSTKKEENGLWSLHRETFSVNTVVEFHGEAGEIQ